MQVQALSSAPKFEVAQLAVCRGLAKQAASHVAAISTLKKKTAGEMLFSEGDDCEGIYEVVTGTLRLYKLLPDGRKQIMGFPSTGHLLGLSPEGTHVYTAEAVSDVVLCRYPRASLERLMESVPGLARRLWAVTSDELRFAQDQMLLLGCKTATEKVASFLLLLRDQQKVTNGEIAVPMTRGDMAAYLGMTIETVSRTLTKFKRDKLIELPTLTRVTFVDEEALEELASGDGE